jgi:hypothetical protein
MAQFVLTARHSSNIGGQHIDRGQSFTINVAMMGITPVNLFNNSRCADTIIKQFSAQGIELPKNSPLLSRGCWDIKMR